MIHCVINEIFKNSLEGQARFNILTLFHGRYAFEVLYKILSFCIRFPTTHAYLNQK